MKRILLASASILAFSIAGAASAEITFGGSATLGYNDDDGDLTGTALAGPVGDNDGFYWDAQLDIGYATELDNGLRAGVTLGIELANNDLGTELSSTDFVFFLESDESALYFGDVQFAAESLWSFGGELVGDAFSEQDNEIALRGDFTYGGFDMSLSGVLADGADDETDVLTGDVYSHARAPNDIDQLSFAVAGEFGAFTFSGAYQEQSDAAGVTPGTGEYAAYDDFVTDEIFGVVVGTVFSGFNIDLAYGQNLTQGINSIGIAVGYEVGALALDAYYAVNSYDDGSPNDGDDDSWGISGAYNVSETILVEASYEDTAGSGEDWGVDVGYDVGNGFLIAGGLDDNGDSYYVATIIALAGAGDNEGASVGISYAVDDSYDHTIEEGDDEIGKWDLQEGITAEITFNF